jgi:hypothetical protein
MVLLADDMSEEEVQSRFPEDPFVREHVAAFATIEFKPSRYQESPVA